MGVPAQDGRPARLEKQRMQPLGQLLSRIKWDSAFGKGSFAVGYYDRVTGEERLVPFEEITTDPERPATLTLQDENGLLVHVPLHRVRTVYKDGVIIWQRRPAI